MADPARSPRRLRWPAGDAARAGPPAPRRPGAHPAGHELTAAPGVAAGPLPHMTEADFEDAMAIHFFAPLSLTLEALPFLPRPGGRIVTIASIEPDW